MVENIFDERIAARYDDTDRAMFDKKKLDVTSSFLADLAGDQRALEFAIGTGRVALPLQSRGVEVHGIELSQSMINQLYAKPNAENINVVVGDMASVNVPGKFQLVYLVYNTITNLITQDQQVLCFKNAASHLQDGGFFVVEDQIPAIRSIPIGTQISAFDASEEHVGIDKFDIVNQTVVSHHYWISGESVEVFNSTHRYAWPAEYDLMAKIAGLQLFERWGDWDKSAFTSDSRSHVSVWRKTF